jgi:hypothetical protein
LLATAALFLTAIACLDPRYDPSEIEAGTRPPATGPAASAEAGSTAAQPTDGSRPPPPSAIPDGGPGPPAGAPPDPALPRFELLVTITGPGSVRAGDQVCSDSCMVIGGERLITLTAQPNQNAVFVSWSGACSGTTPSCSFPAARDQTVSATFRARGDARWTRSLGGNPTALAAGGGTLVVAGFFRDDIHIGETPLSSRGEEDAFLARFSSEGSFEWVRSFGGRGSDEFLAAILDPGGDTVAIGFGQNDADFGNGRIGGPEGEVRVIGRYDRNGQLLWRGAPSSVKALAPLGGRYVTSGFGQAEIFDDRGRSMGGPFDWGGVDVTASATTADGGFIIAGWFYEMTTVGGRMLTSAGSDDPLIVRYGPSRNVVWLSTFRGPGIDGTEYQMAIDARGDVYVVLRVGAAGIVVGDRNHGGTGSCLVKLGGSDGRPLWSRMFADGFLSGVAAFEGDVIVSGAIEIGGDNVDLARLVGATGEPVWLHRSGSYYSRLAVSNGRLYGAGERLAEIQP